MKPVSGKEQHNLEKNKLNKNNINILNYYIPHKWIVLLELQTLEVSLGPATEAVLFTSCND